MTKRQVMVVFFFKQKTAYEMRISDWSSDVCSSDLPQVAREGGLPCPILHGLCSYGFAGLALMAGLCGSRADRITRLDCRFTAPVYPGDELCVSAWKVGAGEAIFKVAAPARGAVVLNNGFMKYKEA